MMNDNPLWGWSYASTKPVWLLPLSAGEQSPLMRRVRLGHRRPWNAPQLKAIPRRLRRASMKGD